jgi:hypothetical protein
MSALNRLRRADLAGDALPSPIAEFVDSHLGPERHLTLVLKYAVSWDHRFFDPIILPGRKSLVTLRDATHQRHRDPIYQNWNLGSRSPGPIFLTISGLSIPQNYGERRAAYTVATPSSIAKPVGKSRAF